MPNYKVKEGKTFGLLAAGEEVQLTEEQAAPHLAKLERVSDTRNDLNVQIDPAQKLIQDDQTGGNANDDGTDDIDVTKEEKDYSSETVVDLRGELERRGLSTVGVKAELIERLQEDDKDGED